MDKKYIKWGALALLGYIAIDYFMKKKKSEKAVKVLDADVVEEEVVVVDKGHDRPITDEVLSSMYTNKSIMADCRKKVKAQMMTMRFATEEQANEFEATWVKNCFAIKKGELSKPKVQLHTLGK